MESDPNKIYLGIVGVGKIARVQHLPAIDDNPDIVLQAAASHQGKVDGVPNFQSIEAMVDAVDGIVAVSLCMPPQRRFEAAKFACERGLHTLLEKPPGASVGEVRALQQIANEHDVSVFAAWHARFNASVESARRYLAGKRVTRARIVWNEDVRRWHPGQDWIWQPGGMGVFDSGINALSILTYVLPKPVTVTGSRLLIPENRSAPIAVNISMADVTGATIDVEFDWRVRDEETWIEVETTDARLVLANRARELEIDGEVRESTGNTEYAAIYRRFTELIRSRHSDVDPGPLQIVADAFLLGEWKRTEAFVEDPAPG